MLRTALLVVALATACSTSDSGTPAAAAKQGGPAPAVTTPAATPATTPRPATVTAAHVAASEKVLAALADVGTKLSTAKDCRAKQAVLEAVAPSLAAIAPEMKKAIDETNADPAAVAWMETHFKDRMKAAALPLMMAAASCKDDAAFMATFSTMPMIKKKGT